MRLKMNNTSMSLEKIREELSYIQSSILENPITRKTYRLPSALSCEMKTLYKMLNIHRSSKAKAL